MLFRPIILLLRLPQECLLTDLFFVSLVTCQFELEHCAFWAFKGFNFDMKQAGSNLRLQLNELDELHNEAYENAKIYKVKTKVVRDKMIFRKSFEPNQKVWLVKSKLKLFPGKLRSRLDDPFVVQQVFPYRVVQMLDPQDGRVLVING